MSQQTELYGIMGNPVEHSVSPVVHQLFAQQCQRQIHYEKMLVPKGGLAPAIAAFKARGGKGLSITVPFKQDAYHLVDESNEIAEKAKAVNNIIITENGKLIGVNTDGIGLVNDIQHNLQLPLANKKILILGAGGAVRGIMQPFLMAKPQQITLVNRTEEKAQQIANEYANYRHIAVCSYPQLADQCFDIIINGTATSLQGLLPPLPSTMPSPLLCYDMMYGKSTTPFLDWAQKQDSQLIADGLGMVVEQAAVIFEIWCQFKPDTNAVIQQLR